MAPRSSSHGADVQSVNRLMASLRQVVTIYFSASTSVVPEAIRGYQKGQILPGVLLDIRNKLIELDGNMPHAVTKFEGTRFSVVFFTRAEALSKEVYEKLQQHGFPSEIIATKAFLRSPIRGPLLRYEHETRTRLRS